MKFTKMQGIGNDYIYVNCFEETVEHPEETARRISDRHFGVGSDGLVLICPDPEADFRMRMFNADGSESDPLHREICFRPKSDKKDRSLFDDRRRAEDAETEC